MCRGSRILEPQVIAQLDCAGVAYRSFVRLAAGGGWIRNVGASHQHSAAASAYPSALRQFHKQGSRMTSRRSAANFARRFGRIDTDGTPR